MNKQPERFLSDDEVKALVTLRNQKIDRRDVSGFVNVVKDDDGNECSPITYRIIDISLSTNNLFCKQPYFSPVLVVPAQSDRLSNIRLSNFN